MTLRLEVKDLDDGAKGPPLARLLTWVAADEGLFREEGLEVVYRGQERQWNVHPGGEDDHTQVSAFSMHYAYEEGTAEVFAGCEWGQVRRAYDTRRGGRVIGRTDGAQWHGIVVARDSPFTHPRALYKQPVAVRFHAGSHYATLGMLEGPLGRDGIKLVNLSHEDGYEAVLRGDIAGVTLPEPWLTLAHKHGHHVVVETREFSAEIGAEEIDPEAYAAYNRARGAAAKLVNADPRKYIERYLDRILGVLPERYRGDVGIDDFEFARFYWNGPQAYSEDEFQRTYEWMVERGLIGDDADYDRLVNREVTAAAA